MTKNPARQYFHLNIPNGYKITNQFPNRNLYTEILSFIKKSFKGTKEIYIKVTKDGPYLVYGSKKDFRKNYTYR